jgi:hypothetical protein
MVGSFSNVYNNNLNGECLFLTSSKCVVPGITKELIIKSNNQRFPKLNYEIIMTSKNAYMVIDNNLHNKKDKYISLITPKLEKVSDIDCNIKNHKIHDYNDKGVSVYKNYKKEGGILLCSIKKISEGNNLNKTSLAYIVNPVKCTSQTIQQCVGRFYRESNINVEVNIVFVIPDTYDNLWARCKLSMTEYIGFDAKSNEQIETINSFLISQDYHFNNFTDVEFLCIYSKSLSSKLDLNSLKIKLKNITYEDLIKCMLV